MHVPGWGRWDGSLAGQAVRLVCPLGGWQEIAELACGDDVGVDGEDFPGEDGMDVIVEGRVNHIILWNQICQVLQVVGLLFAGSHAGGAVDAFAQQVRMAVVPGVLSDHVHHDPSQ